MTNQRSIAVLPFENFSADRENDYFADGISEEIINALSKIEGLKVTARASSFSFRDNKSDVRIIGNELGVNTVLDGSIRRVGNRVRISAQLVRTDNGFHIWSENFDRELENIFLLQDEISILIAEKIRENYGHFEIARHLTSAPTENIEAYELYLKGRFNHLKWDWEGLQNGIKYYDESIAKEPSFALPYFGLAFCYTMIASWAKRPELFDLSEDLLAKGFSYDEKSDLGFFAKATLEFWGRWDFINGEKSYLKAISLNHTNSEAMEGLAELYIAIGYFEEAEAHTKEALKVNPISANHLFTMGCIHYMQGDLEKALTYYNSGLRVDKYFEHCISYKALTLIGKNEISKLDLHVAAYPERQDKRQCLMLGNLINNKTVQAEHEVKQLIDDIEDEGLVGWRLYLLVHNKRIEDALTLLEKVISNKEGQYVNFSHLPLLKPLHNLPRFQNLVSSVFNKASLPSRASVQIDRVSAPKALLSDNEINQVETEISDLMDNEKIYLDPSISLRAMADRIEINPNRLSWFLNDILGKNFSEFINERRVSDFKERSLSNDWEHLSLLGLAYECGFNSKSVFNDYFKKSVGQTPSQWIKSNKV